MLSVQLHRIICLSLNHLVTQEAWAQQRLRPFAGSHIQIDGLPFLVSLEINEQGLFCYTDEAHLPDVTLLMPTDTFGLGLVAPETLISSVKITGSVDIAEALGFVFRHLKWDIESDLAALVGDIPAHRAYRIGTSVHKQVIEGTERISTNLVEFARNETNFLVTNFELTDFYSRVDYIRDDLARLEQRIKRL